MRSLCIEPRSNWWGPTLEGKKCEAPSQMDKAVDRKIECLQLIIFSN